jgi:hypothetical protein
MAANNTANVKQWLEQSDIDYFTHFVKAWIPFNAWYRHTYDKLEQERDILEEIKTDGNKIRTRFMAKIEGNDPDSEEIRNHIAALHRRLSADPLEDRKKRRVSFENVCIGRNPNVKESFNTYGWTYTVERQKSPAKQVVCQLVNRSGTVEKTIIQLGEWDLEAIQGHGDFLLLQDTDQSRMLVCYKQANPFRFRSLVASATDRKPLEMDKYKFVGDRAAIFAGVVDVLYAMRNLLFHGELVPDSQANRTYEPAYHLLRHLIAKIT